MTAGARSTTQSAGPDRTFEYVTTLDAALDARELFGARMGRVDLIIDVVALLAGALLFALGQLIGLLLVVGALVFLLFGRRIQGLILGYKGRSMLGRRTAMRVNEEGLHVSNDLASMHLPWTSLTSVRANGKVVIFTRDRLLAFYAPSAAFASPQEQADFVRFASERIAGSRRSA